ncbi:MAG: adenylosuccinate lyase, partial [Candidatus Methanomethylophilaceae archaeon]|nr:adenylosuccinate lyase [Candidatus Methanomethylophilaceae archaeon]
REASMTAMGDGRQLRDVVVEVMASRNLKFMTEAEIRDAMDPSKYTGGAGEIVDRTVSDIENALKRKV